MQRYRKLGEQRIAGVDLPMIVSDVCEAIVKHQASRLTNVTRRFKLGVALGSGSSLVRMVQTRETKRTTPISGVPDLHTHMKMLGSSFHRRPRWEACEPSSPRNMQTFDETPQLAHFGEVDSTCSAAKWRRGCPPKEVSYQNG